MKILIVGIEKSNMNSRKIEGFYNSFRKLGEVEWVTNLFQCKSREYDIVFGEMSIGEILNRFQEYKNLDIRVHILWRTFDISRLVQLADAKKDTFFISACKSNILDRSITSEFIRNYGEEYQMYEDEGVSLVEFTKDLQISRQNLHLCYLPCSLSEKEEFISEKPYDICYFGTIRNRPAVEIALTELAKHYRVLTNTYDTTGIMHPNQCYELYKQTKTTISEQVHPVILELPVRLGESTSTGCKLFLFEPIQLIAPNKLIPNYTSCQSTQSLITEISRYLDNYSTVSSRDLYNSFEATYDNAVRYLLDIVQSNTDIKYLTDQL